MYVLAATNYEKLFEKMIQLPAESATEKDLHFSSETICTLKSPSVTDSFYLLLVVCVIALRPSKDLFSNDETFSRLALSQFKAEDKVSCSRAQHSASSESVTIVLSEVKHFTTDPLRFSTCYCCSYSVD